MSSRKSCTRTMAGVRSSRASVRASSRKRSRPQANCSACSGERGTTVVRPSRSASDVGRYSLIATSRWSVQVARAIGDAEGALAEDRVELVAAQRRAGRQHAAHGRPAGCPCGWRPSPPSRHAHGELDRRRSSAWSRPAAPAACRDAPARRRPPCRWSNRGPRPAACRRRTADAHDGATPSSGAARSRIWSRSRPITRPSRWPSAGRWRDRSRTCGRRGRRRGSAASSRGTTEVVVRVDAPVRGCTW